jgi:hypothetical protein
MVCNGTALALEKMYLMKLILYLRVHNRKCAKIAVRWNLKMKKVGLFITAVHFQKFFVSISLK